MILINFPRTVAYPYSKRLMKISAKKYLYAFLLVWPFHGYSQIAAADSLPVKSAQPLFKKEEVQNIRFKNYFLLLGDDFKQQALAPFRLTGSEWLKVGDFALITTATILSDEPINHSINDFRNHSVLVQKVSPVVTRFGGKYELGTLGAIEAYGLIFKNEKLKTTTILATQAYLISGIWVNAIKFISGRERPSYYDPKDGENEGAWHGPFFQFHKNNLGFKPDGSEYSSFASGHATVAFAVATVFAKQYSEYPIVPIISYSAATLVSLSRMTENKHWASDVLVGAAIGYFSGRQVVRNYRKFAHAGLIRKKQGVVKFDLGYNHGLLMPGLTYTFR
ncbi:MAG: phosphatase PAP2 family protein [Chitinophagaceae bacterium]